MTSLSSCSPSWGRQAGFSLIELMVTIAIFAIIVAIAYPNYENYIRKGHRTSAKTALLTIASREERYYSTNNVYAPSLTTLGFPTTTIGGNAVYQVPADGTPYYNVILFGHNTTYSITATPIAGTTQAQDDCNTFTLNYLGQQGVANNTGSTTAAACWK